MNERTNDTLLEIAEALADGAPVDWEGLERRQPALAEEVARLRALADVAAAYRELRESPEPETGHDKD